MQKIIFYVFALAIFIVSSSSATHPSLEDPLFLKTKHLKLSVVCDKACFTILSTRGNVIRVIYDIINSELKPRLGRLNVQVYVVQMEVWNQHNEFYLMSNSGKFLEDLKEYRSKNLITKVWSDATIALTGYLFEGHQSSAYPDSVCSARLSLGYVKIESSTSARTIASYMAHEIGHIIGLGHDDEPSDTSDSTSCCPRGVSNCIMNAYITSIGHAYGEWSTCSTAELVEDLKKPSRTCLWKKPKQVLFSFCGNGIVDNGEDCDCGHSNIGFCKNCCDPQTCRFKPNSKCAEGECCTEQCQLKTANTVCRNVTNSCDVQDVCSGTSNKCVDESKDDGFGCLDGKGGGGYCLSGKCMTINNECIEHWRDEFEASDVCMRESLFFPDSFGNCGSINGAYISCTETDEKNYKCGSLQCSYNGNKSYRDLVDSILFPRTRQINGESCYARDKYSWLGEGSQMVSDGVKCGENKVCYKTDCLPKDKAYSLIKSNNPQESSAAAVCGNGKIEPGEQCDCGASQCGCCDSKCQLRPAGATCSTDSCRTCSGISYNCNGSWKPTLSPCDDNYGHCVNYGIYSKCVSHQSDCKELFGEFADVDEESMKRNYENSKYYNFGGYFLANSSLSVTSMEIPGLRRETECGSLKCLVPVSKTASIPGFLAVTESIKTPNSERVLKTVTFTNTVSADFRYDDKYILFVKLAKIGTPCKTLSTNQRGYCYPFWKKRGVHKPIDYPTSVCVPY